jgi:fatty-acid desaturase
MRYRLRTLMIVLALGPPIIALAWWYGRLAVGVLVLALIVFPELLIYAFAGLYHLFGGKPRDASDEKRT